MLRTTRGATWRVCSGLLDRVEEGVGGEEAALSSRGGGGWGVQCVVEGSVCKCGGGGRGHGSEKDALLFQKRRTGWVAEQADTVSASCHCHCRGVRFKLTRPDAASPGPDGAGGARWWLRDSGQHYAAVFDVCASASCRRTTGFELVAWAHVPRVKCLHVGWVARLSWALARLQAMGVARAFIGDFCGRCGAGVFLPEGRSGGGGVGCGGGVAGGREWGEGGGVVWGGMRR
jgi:hypothetical protein